MEVFEKSQTVDPEVRAYISSLVNAVGGQSTLDDRYEIGDDALAVLNDILRWLRLYDDKTDRYDVKRCLADAHFVQNDVLSILSLWPEDAHQNKWKAKLALACLQLIVTLTWPLEVSEEKTKVNHVRHMPVLLLAHVGYKRAILHYEEAQILRTIVRVGLPAMAVTRRERSRRDEGIIRLMLYCFRNLTMITQPQHLPSQGDENEVSRSATIDAFYEQDVFSLLLTIGSGANDEFNEHDVIVLETLFHLLKGVDARKLFMDEKQVNKAEINELQSLMRKEKAMLNNQNKHAPTRHNRFGTMVWVKRDDHKVSTVTGQSSITNASATLQQMDASKKFDKPRTRGKQALLWTEPEEFGERVELIDKARKHLRSFVEDFIDSSFNPLFSNLRKGIESENDRVRPSNHKQFWYLISWFLQAEAARREKNNAERKSSESANPADVDNTFAYIAAVLDQETFVLLNRHMQRALDEKSWQELRATLLCFTQILLTVQSMAESRDEEDQEIAENIQNRIFYEETTHDRMVQVCRTYTNQGFGYLDAMTECVHVFVRLLEAYSKQNVDLQIRSKRRARKKQRKQESQTAVDEGQDNDDAEEAAEDERLAHMTVRERNFDFARFSAKFLSQGCVNTFVALTHFYQDLTPAQLKRCHRFYYRLAFKHDLAVIAFRVDILLLFHRMIKGPTALDPGIDGYKDWQTLIQQIFRKCFKWIDRETEGEGWREAAMVEMLFSKIPGTLFYLQNGFERVREKRAPRAPAELEVRPGVVDIEKRIGVAVSLMLELGKADAVEWAKKELRGALEERQAWQDANQAQADRQSAPDDGEESSKDQPLPPTILVGPDTDERKEALFKDKHLRLLLTTLGIQRLGTADDTEAAWAIPSELTTDKLKEALDHIRAAEFDPPTFEDGQTAQSLIRTKPSAAARERAAFIDSDSEGSDAEAAAFPPNLREQRAEGAAERPTKRPLTKRNRAELTEEQVAEREANRRKKEKERNGKIKSKLFVTESDDESDDERDREFFRLEEERRRKVAGAIGRAVEGLGLGVLSGDESEEEASVVARKQRKRSHLEASGSEDEVHAMDVDRSDDGASSQASAAGIEGSGSTKRRRVTRTKAKRSLADGNSSSLPSDDEDADEQVMIDDAETPSTSQPAVETAASPLKEVSVNAAATRPSAPFLEDDSDDDDDEPVVKAPAQRRLARRGVIMDDDDGD